MKKNSEYAQKLRDPRWQKKRLEVMERANFACESCGSSTDELQVHHGFYEKGKEPWEYDKMHLWCLCKMCHESADVFRKEISRAASCVAPNSYGLALSSVFLAAAASRINRETTGEWEFEELRKEIDALEIKWANILVPILVQRGIYKRKGRTMTGYTKLFSSIITSSIWTEDDQTRIVWITLLALADRHGEVAASIPGLARVAGVSVEACENAIAKFMAPDPYSRTPDEEGRRIERIEGGWALVNHAKYRAAASEADEREKAAIRQKRLRDKKKDKTEDGVTVTDSNAPSRSVTPSNAKSRQAEADADAEAESKTPYSPPAGDGLFDEFWIAYPRKVNRKGALKSYTAANLSDDEHRRMILHVRKCSTSKDWMKDGGQFIPHPTTYLNQRRWEELLETPAKVEPPMVPGTVRYDKSISDYQ